MITIINDLLIYTMLVMTNYEISIINDKLDELLKILRNNDSRNKDEELGKE